MPPAPPVMTATFPERSNSASGLTWLSLVRRRDVGRHSALLDNPESSDLDFPSPDWFETGVSDGGERGGNVPRGDDGRSADGVGERGRGGAGAVVRRPVVEPSAHA